MRNLTNTRGIIRWPVLLALTLVPVACMQDPFPPEPFSETEPPQSSGLLASPHTASLQVSDETISNLEPACLSNSDCPGPFTCIGRECRGCSEEGLCPFGGGICDTALGQCVQPDDCQFNSQLCMAPTDVCVSDTEGGSHCVDCVTDGHCPSGQICDWDPATNTGKCLASDDCFANDRCDLCVQTGECEAPPGSVCVNPYACPSGTSCDPVSFICLPADCEDIDQFATIQSQVGAAPLTSGEHTGLTVCPRRPDRFTFDVQPGVWIRITVRSEIGANVGAVVEPLDLSASYPARVEGENHERVITFEAFPDELVWEGGYGMIRIWPVGDLQSAAYTLTLETSAR